MGGPFLKKLGGRFLETSGGGGHTSISPPVCIPCEPIRFFEHLFLGGFLCAGVPEIYFSQI